MAIIGGLLLFAACLFLLYALARFYIEAVRPQRRQEPRKGVIVFRRIVEERQLNARSGASRLKEFEDKARDPVPPLPFGVRRLAVKRAARG